VCDKVYCCNIYIYTWLIVDSETSDVTESTDMSEVGDTTSGMLLATSESPGCTRNMFTPVKSSHL